MNKNTSGGGRTHDLPLRRRTPYPFGHGGIYNYVLFFFYIIFKIINFILLFKTIYFLINITNKKQYK